MTIPTPAQVPVIVLDLDTLATRAEKIVTTIRDAADSLERCIEGMNWSGEGRKGAENRVTAERQQMRTLATAFEALATACRDGQAAMSPTLDKLRSGLKWLGENGYAVANDWTVTDTFNYSAATSADTDERFKDQLTALQNSRANEAANQTVTMQQLALGYGVADDACAQAIGDAVSDIQVLAPDAAGLSPKVADKDLADIQSGRATPEQIARLQAATTLTDQQLDDLVAGRPVNIPQGQFDYLREVMRDLDDTSVDKIAQLGDKLPAGQEQTVRAGLADALQVMSNPQIGTAATLDEGQSPRTPDRGGMVQLPTSVQTLLTEKPYKSNNTSPRAGAAGGVIDVPRIGEFNALTDLLGDGNARLAEGTDVDRGLLKQGAEIAANHDNTLLGTNAGSPTANELADRLLSRGGIDNAAVHDLLTGENMQVTVTAGGTYNADSRVAGLLNHDWKGNETGISTVITTAGEFATSNDPIQRLQAGQSADVLASYVDKHADELLHISTYDGVKSLGVVNPEMTQALASALSPYIPDMVGVRENLLHTDGFDSNFTPSDVKNVFAVIDSNKDAAVTFNASAYAAISQLNQQFGMTGGDDYALGEWAGKIDAAARDGMQLEADVRKIDATQQNKEQIALFDSAREIAAFGAKRFPVIGDDLLELAVKSGSPEVKLWLLGSVPTGGATLDLSPYANPSQRYYNILEGMTLAPDRPDLRSDPNVGQYFDPDTGKLKSLEEIGGQNPDRFLTEFDGAMRNFLPELVSYNDGWRDGHGVNGVPPK